MKEGKREAGACLVSLGERWTIFYHYGDCDPEDLLYYCNWLARE